MLALVASIHVLNAAFDQRREDVDGRDKPDHDDAGGYSQTLSQLPFRNLSPPLHVLLPETAFCECVAAKRLGGPAFGRDKRI
jgi:hypothetical protein